MILPLIFIILATLASAVTAYGTDPSWAQYSRGLDLILWSRRLEWPLVSFSILMCLVLLVLVITGKRRAWWLIGLAPILALMAHQFHLKPGSGMTIIEYPADMPVASWQIANNASVVGVTFGDQAYAFPYSVLFNSPGVIVQDQEKKFMLIWSAYANRAIAVQVDLDVRARDLEVVSSPANSLLIYNSRLGQFIIGVTGKTEKGETPGGFHQPLQVTKTTWAKWLAANPKTMLMTPPLSKSAIAQGPTGAILPHFPMPDVFNGVDPQTRIAVVQSTPPAAIVADTLGDDPANLTFGDSPILLLRDGPGGTIRAYDRRIDTDLFVRLKPYHSTKKPLAAYIDDSSNSFWSHNIVALEGGPEVKGKKLTKIPVEEDLYWGVMKYWYRDLQLYQPK